MSFALPEAMRDYIDGRVRSGQYGNTSEYLRDLIRRDQRDEAARRLSELIAEGLDQHISKGYIYFAMGFSIFVEIINIRMRRREAPPVHLRAGYSETPQPPLPEGEVSGH